MIFFFPEIYCSQLLLIMSKRWAPKSVTKRSVWVRLLTAQKPIKRPDWWKGKFALFQMLATKAGGCLSKGWLPSPDKQEARAPMDRGGGGLCRNSTVVSNSRLYIGHQWSHQHQLVLGTVNPHFQGVLVPVSLRCDQFLELWQLVVTVW